jgi:hypothetical protein
MSLSECQVAGQVQLDLYPRGIRKEFLTLPREIVEAETLPLRRFAVI